MAEAPSGQVKDLIGADTGVLDSLMGGGVSLNGKDNL